MLCALLCVAALAADPVPAGQAELLAKFRKEFVAFTPGEAEFPADFLFGEGHGRKAASQKPVKIAFGRRFSIAKFEVPQNLWEAVTGKNPSRWKGPRNAVEMVTYEEAVDFCRRATVQMRAAQLIGQEEEIRLPSEAEWEYACRAGTRTKYSFGDDEALLGDYAWFTGNAAGNDPPGGMKKANPWGLFDMHGYIREWVADAASVSWEGLPTDGSPRLIGDASKRIVRGGSWKDPPAQLTSDARMFLPADTRDDAVGFRCVLAAARREPPKFEPTAQEKLIPAAAKLELLWGEGEFTEGPAAAPDGSILFSDIGNTIYRFDPRTGNTAKFRDPSGRSNGLVFDRDGRLIACEGANTGGGRRISVTRGIRGDADGRIVTLSDGYEGKRFNSPNDLAIGPNGWVYFTDPRYVGDDPRDLPYECVFAVGPDGKTSIATRDIGKPNGIIFSPDGKYVYVADNNPSGDKQLVRFQVNEQRQFTDKFILWDFRPGRGIDGMKVDGEGNIYATAGTGKLAGVYVFSPDGKPLALIPTPGDPTNCCFGGEDGKTLYITAGVSGEGKKYGLFRIRLALR